MRLRTMAMGLAMGACCMMGVSSAQAQMNEPMKMESGTMSPAKAMDQVLALYEHEVMGVANTMPADKYSFAPTTPIFAPGQAVKFDTVRTFAQEVTHLTQANYYFYSAVGGMKPDVDVKAISDIHTKDEAVAALARSFRFAHKAIATITTANAFLQIPPVDGMTTRVSVAAFGVAHGYDHYGQLVEYLRMNGLVPPGSK